MLDLRWRGIATPLARLVGPLLRVPGFSFLSEAGVPMFRYTTGETTIHAALRGNVAVVSLEAEVVKQALERQATRTGLAARASRELLDRIRQRSADAVRILVDTKSLSTGLFSGSPLGARILQAVEAPGQSMLDVELSNERLRIGAELPVSIVMPELEKTLDRAPATLGVLRYVPASAYLLTVSNIAPLGELYRLVAAFQGQDVQGDLRPGGFRRPQRDGPGHRASCCSPGWARSWGPSCCRPPRRRYSSPGSPTSAPSSGPSRR